MEAIKKLTGVETVLESLGVALGPGLIILTGINWLDPIIAICVALLILNVTIHVEPQ
jgi:divalent metal cation (Fe/Co/Zn/Cd) transporter